MKEKIFSVGIKDCRVDVFRAGGKGGQHQNKTSSGVRVTHTGSGAIGKSTETRSQHQNKRIAFIRMSGTKAFKTWCKIEASRIVGKSKPLKSVEERVEESMADKNLRIETKDSKGYWIEKTL